MPFYEAFYVFFALVIENDSFSWTLNEHIEHGDMQTDIIFKFLNILKFIFLDMESICTHYQKCISENELLSNKDYTTQHASAGGFM
jgi:hypothetical protein